MSRAARRSVVGALSALAAMVVGVGLAWACTPAAYLFLSKTGAAPGTTITISGKEFAPGPVEIEWTGAPAAQRTMVTGPSFSVPVAVPDIEPGVYYVQATALDDFGGIEGQATRAFKVSVPAPAPTPGRTEARLESSPNADPVPGARAERRSQAPGAAPPAPSRPPTPAAIAPQAPAAAPTTAAPAAPAARESERETASTPSSPTSARTSSQRAAVADLWSGFAGEAEPTLRPSTTTATSAGASGSRMLGIALLCAGLAAAMLAGFAVASVRRPRAPARR